MSKKFLTNIAVTGTVSGTRLLSTQSLTNEGGEIVLSLPSSGSTLNTSVTIDLYNDRVRFFETGGTSRGFYIDLSAGTANAGTNLVGGGSASNSFATISTPSGTSPVADSSTDTLTFTTDSYLTITGDSATDTIAFATGATSTNTASKIVARDASGDFSAGTITASIFASTNNGLGTNFKVGDDAWIGDINLANTISIQGQQNSANGYISFGTNDGTVLGRAGTGALTYGGNTIWHAGNDGASSGLDADTLDTKHASDFALLAGATFTGTIITATPASGTIALRIPHGAAPGTPTNGDIWTTTSGLYARINGSTVGPFSSTTGTVTTVSVASTNGFAGTVTNASTTPAITISTSITGMLKGNGTAISAATAGTDYVTPTGTETLTNKTLTLPIIGGTGATFNGSTSGTTVLKANATAGTTTITMPAANGIMALTSDIPTVNTGTLALTISGAAASGTAMSVSSGSGFNANSSGSTTYTIATGPALTEFATKMSGTANVGSVLSKGAADTISWVTALTNPLLNTTGLKVAYSGATQDAIVVLGRNGGTSSYAVTLTTGTLASSTTITLPNATGTALVSLAAKAAGYFDTGAVAPSNTTRLNYDGDFYANNIVASGDIAVNGGDLTTSTTGTAAIFNTNATTLNIGGAATSVNIGGTNASILLGSGTASSIYAEGAMYVYQTLDSQTTALQIGYTSDVSIGTATTGIITLRTSATGLRANAQVYNGALTAGKAMVMTSSTTNYAFGPGSTSSIRYKQQVEPFTWDKDLVLSLETKKFKYNADVEAVGDDAPWHYGLIAEDVDAAGLDWLVAYHEELDLPDYIYWSERMPQVLFSIVQQLNEENKQLKSELEIIKDRLSAAGI